MSSDLREAIQTVSILNVDETESSVNINQMVSNKTVDDKLYILSDVDDELLILIEFKSIIDLHSVKLYALVNTFKGNDDMDTSPPKQVHIYKLSNLSANFDDMKSIKPDKSIKCSVKKLNKGQVINLQKNASNRLKFKKTKYMAIYIETNQNDTETTFLNYIQFNGRLSLSNIDSNIISGLPSKSSKINQVSNKNTSSVVFDQCDAKMKRKFKEMKQILDQTDAKKSMDETLEIQTTVQAAKHLRREPEIINCILFDCKCLERMKQLLTRYNAFVASQTTFSADSKNNDCEILENINISSVLNDFHHLLQIHEGQFEEIYDELTEHCNDNTTNCDLGTCKIIRRNHRNRRIVDINSMNLKLMYFNCDDHDLVKQQILDKIH
eukprot:259657_1